MGTRRGGWLLVWRRRVLLGSWSGSGLLLQLLSLLLLFLLRHVMPDHASRGGADHAVMPGKMSCNTTDDGPFDTSFGVRSRRAGQERYSEQWCGGSGVQFHDIPPRQSLDLLALL